MSIESQEDLIALRKIGAIVAQALQVMKAEVRPGRTTGELDRIAGAYLAQNDAKSAPQARIRVPGSHLH